MRPFFTLCAASQRSRTATPSAASPYRRNTDFGTGTDCRALFATSARPCLTLQAALEEVKAGWMNIGAGYQLGITALYVLLCPALLLRHELEAALEMIEQGLLIASHNGERIFEAELYRLKARALLVRGAPEAEARPCSTRL